MIELSQVSKTYDQSRTFAVSDVNLAIPEGQLLVLLGESGCGKTTTLKMINRLIEPTSGQITVNGKDVMEFNPVLLRREIGYVFQGIGLFPHMTIEENISIVPQLLGWDKEKIKNRVSELLELVGLDPGEFAGRRPAKLSGGQQQRVGVARALAAGSRLMLMDEPFGALDPITRGELQSEFNKLRRRLNLTTVLVTHDILEALLLADNIAAMKEGKIVAVGTPQQMMTRPANEYVRKLMQTPKEQIDQLDDLLLPGETS